jgi:hypothetical protein
MNVKSLVHQESFSLCLSSNPSVTYSGFLKCRKCAWNVQCIILWEHPKEKKWKRGLFFFRFPPLFTSESIANEASTLFPLCQPFLLFNRIALLWGRERLLKTINSHSLSHFVSFFYSFFHCLLLSFFLSNISLSILRPVCLAFHWALQYNIYLNGST